MPGLVALASWPSPDPAWLQAEMVTMVVQVDGRLRDRIEMRAGSKEAEVRDRALQSANVRRALDGRPVARAVFVADRLINLVTGRQ
jgi:leucyl-tRNA synthetase